MKITLCSSTISFKQLWKIRDILEKRGYEVFIPNVNDFHHLDEDALSKIHYDLIRKHFKKIDKSDAVYIVNCNKKGIDGYIGGNTFLEMGMAFYKEIPIFLLNDIPRDVSYREELIALKPIVIGKDWDKLDNILESL